MKKWNFKTLEYEEYTVPDSWKVKTICTDMNEKVNCAACGKPLFMATVTFPGQFMTKTALAIQCATNATKRKLRKNELMTDKQRDLIKAMNEFCKEKFDLSYPRTKEEAREYIGRNFKEYKMQSTIDDNWNAMNGEF